MISCAGGEAASINITNCNIRSSRCIICIARNNSSSNIIHRGDNNILHRKSDKTDRQCGRGTDSIFGTILVAGVELGSILLVCAALDDELGDADDEVVWRVGGAAAVITPSSGSSLWEASSGDMSMSMGWCRGDKATLPSSEERGYGMCCRTWRDVLLDGLVGAVVARTIAAGPDIRGSSAAVVVVCPGDSRGAVPQSRHSIRLIIRSLHPLNAS